MTKFLKKTNILFERLIMFFLVIIFLISAWCVYDCWYVYEHTSDKNLLRYKPDKTTTAVMGEKVISDDMTAWLTVYDTDIDCPVMQGSDNIKYLNTNPFGEYSLGGSIFLDSRNSPDFSDSYSLIYGHHMEYGRMFGTLDSFLEKEYLESHRNGLLEIGRSAEKTYRLKIFSAMRASAKDKAVFEPQENNIADFIEKNLHISVDRSKKILGLSTCTEGDSVSRIIVFCYIEE